MRGGETVHLKQRGYLARATEAVLNTDAKHRHGATLAHDLAHGGAEAADDVVLLGGDDGSFSIQIPFFLAASIR